MIEVISELAEKVNILLEKSDNYKAKIEQYHREIFDKNSYIQEIEQENTSLSEEAEILRQTIPEKDQYVIESTEKLREIIDRVSSTQF